jgi:hypothetical protein
MLTCRKEAVRESAAQWDLDALVETPGGDLLPCFREFPKVRRVAVIDSFRRLFGLTGGPSG